MDKYSEILTITKKKDIKIQQQEEKLKQIKDELIFDKTKKWIWQI